MQCIKGVKLLYRRKENFIKLTPKTKANENKVDAFSNLSVKTTHLEKEELCDLSV